MTVQTPEDFGDVGLEDVDSTDLVLPRLNIDHTKNVFVNNITGEEYESLTAIVLGLVKQRIMWPDDVDEGDKPKCKSPDFENGFPNVNPEAKADKRFDFVTSNFNPEDYPPEKGINGLVTLPCKSCVFSQWDKNGWRQPPCNEQHTYPLLFSTDDGATFQPAIFTTARTGIKPSRQFISGFASSKQPFFTQLTHIELNHQKKGSVRYSVPSYRRIGASDTGTWGEYAGQFRGIRDFLRAAPANYDAEDGESEGVPLDANENTAPVASTPAPTPTPAPEPTPTPEPKAEPTPTPAPAPSAVADDDDDLPF